MLEEEWEVTKGSYSDWRKAEESGLETAPMMEEWSGQARGPGMAEKTGSRKDSKSEQALARLLAGMKDRTSVKAKAAASAEA
jgi:hypothetical protein